MQKGVFLWSVFCFLVVLFFVACVFVLLFCKRPTRLFSCNFRGFCLFCSPRRPVLKCFGLPFLFSFLVGLLSSLSKFQFVLCFLSINLFLEKTLFGGLFCLYFFVFSLMFACFRFGHSFFCCFCFHGVCFCPSVLMLALFLLCFLTLFSFCFCFVSCCAFRL